MPQNPVVLITGASTGFGRQTALILAKNNFIVYGTSRSQMTFPEYPMLQLDVTCEDSIRFAVDKILADQGQIDVLINNAGCLLSGLIEEVSIDEAQSLFDTNFFGVHRMIQAVLPHMRARRTGRIVNISSLGGLVAAPGHGFYYASKFALEGYTESLAHEVRHFNIAVSLVEPGFFRTNLHVAMRRSTQQIPDYDTIRKPLFDMLEKNVTAGRSPADVAALILKILRCPSPKLRYQIGPGAHWIPFFKFLLPQKCFALAVKKIFHLPD